VAWIPLHAALAILMRAYPILGILICLGMPAVIVFTVKHFKLRHRELELEAELHGNQTQARLAAVEARLGTLETALGALVRAPRCSRSALAAGAPPSSSEAPTESDPQRVRTR